MFPYLTDPELMVRWMGDWADLQPEAGGRFSVDITGVPIRGSYTVVEPPHRVVFTWGAAGNAVLPPGSTTVEIRLSPDGDHGTLLELAHRDLPPEELPQHRIGWTHFLARLEVAGTGADPGPDPWAPDPDVAVDILTETTIDRPVDLVGGVRGRPVQRPGVVRQHRLGRVGDASPAPSRIEGGVRRPVPRPARRLRLRDRRARVR